jgi:predicted MFS family arabinose efflux permease
LLKHRVFAANIGLSTLSFAGIFVWISASSVVLQNIYGLNPMQFGIAFAITGGGYFSGTLLATRLLPRLGLDRTMGIGATALAVSGIAMMLVLMLGIHHVAGIVTPMAVSTCGLGLLFPQAIAGGAQSVSRPGRRGLLADRIHPADFRGGGQRRYRFQPRQQRLADGRHHCGAGRVDADAMDRVAAGAAGLRA